MGSPLLDGVSHLNTQSSLTIFFLHIAVLLHLAQVFQRPVVQKVYTVVDIYRRMIAVSCLRSFVLGEGASRALLLPGQLVRLCERSLYQVVYQRHLGHGQNTYIVVAIKSFGGV